MQAVKLIFILCVFSANIPFCMPIAAQVILSKSVLGNGGETLNDSCYNIIGTLGQPIIGVVDNSSNINNIGFWYLPHHTLTTSVEQSIEINIPKEYLLEHNYPNPFNPETTIQFALPTSGEVELIIYNMLGQVTRRLVKKEYSVGIHTIKWDGRNDFGVQVASGVYLYRFKSKDFVSTKKMLLVR